MYASCFWSRQAPAEPSIHGMQSSSLESCLRGLSSFPLKNHRMPRLWEASGVGVTRVVLVVAGWRRSSVVLMPLTRPGRARQTARSYFRAKIYSATSAFASASSSWGQSGGECYAGIRSTGGCRRLVCTVGPVARSVVGEAQARMVALCVFS